MDNYSPDLEDLARSWDLWMASAGRTEGTRKTYRDGLRLYFRYCDENGKPCDLDKVTVQEFIADVLARNSSATAIARYKAVTQFSKWLLREGEIDTDTLATLARPTEDVPVVEAFTDAELSALVRACQGTSLRDRRDEALIRVITETGLRASECLALTVPDVDVIAGRAIIRKAKSRKGRTVTFGPNARTALDRYLRTARRQRLITDDGPLWVGAGGRTFGYSGLDDTLKRRAEAAGVPNFKIHRLRNTFSARWLRNGGSEGGLMQMAGWASRQMLDRYVRASAAERAAEEASRLNLGDF